MGRITAYIGGARSGKSRLALQHAHTAGDDVAFVATCQPLDDEMRARVDRHRRERSKDWQTVECPIELAAALRSLSAPRCILVDCLTLWASNLLCAERSENEIFDAFADVLRAARELPGEVVFITNEVGCGVVPEHELGRRFRDVAGWINQRLGDAADDLYWVVCGRAVPLKREGKDHVLF
jgi:adenosylcobinamide kinase/adenosylcobinamide-phosphate guanylyltransferase